MIVAERRAARLAAMTADERVTLAARVRLRARMNN